MGDCQGALHLFQRILEADNPDRVANDLRKHDDADVLRLIIQIVHAAPPDFFRCEWVPSHLLDPPTGNQRQDNEQEAKLKKFLEGGGLREDLQGNRQADILANTRANAAKAPDSVLQTHQ